MKIAALQLDTQPLSNSRLDYYFRICEQKGVKVIALGEYVLNNFLRELENMPEQIIKEQSKVKLDAIKEYSKNYNLCIIAPIILPYKKGFKKTCLIANNGKVKYIDQQILMPYDHWNEENFFNNPKKPIKLHSIKVGEFKLCILFGFEMHFDEFFKSASDADLLILPTANTYDSNERWIRLIRTRAFLKNINILRVNRIGKVIVDNLEWRFYGNTFLCDGYGDIVEELADSEEMLIMDLKKDNKASKFWKFKEMSKDIEKRLL